MTSDPSLNKALESIFEKLSQKRAGSVPPLPTQLHHHHHHNGQGERYAGKPPPAAFEGHPGRAATSMASAPSPSSLLPSAKRSGRDAVGVSTTAAAHSHRSVSGNSGGGGGGTSTRGKGGTKLRPLQRPPKFPVEVVDPATRIHTEDCFLYHERLREMHLQAQQAMIERERSERNAIRLDETATFHTERDAFVARVLEAKAREAREQKRTEALSPEDIALQRIVDAMLKRDKSVRRELRTQWEAGFDEIAAAHKLSLRQFRQVQTVKKLTSLRQKQEAEDAAAAEKRRSEEMLLSRQRMAREAVEGEETTQRKHVLSTESGVRGAIMTAFSTAKDKIRDHEIAVQVLLLNHGRRLAGLEADKEKCVVDEAAAREKHTAQEKKAFEALAATEPDLRRRAANMATMRVRRENRERVDLCDAQAEARQKLEAEEAATRANVDALYAAEHARELHEDARRSVVHKRRQWRLQCEAAMRGRMQAADDAAWAFVRWQFERSIDDDVAAEEKAERLRLVELRTNDRARITANARARFALAQAESRTRSEIAKEISDSIDAIIAEIQNSESLFSLEWCERLLRRINVEEYDEACDDMIRMAAVLARTSSVVADNPRSRTDRGYTGATCGFAVWLRTSSATCFFGSTGCPLLEGTTLKDDGGRPLLAVESLHVRLELLNPCEGDMVEVLGPKRRGSSGLEFAAGGVNSSSQFVKPSRGGSSTTLAGSEIVETTYSGGVADLLDSMRFCNVSHFSRTKTATARVVKITLANEVEIVVYVAVLPPLCLLPEVFVSTGTVAPLKFLNVPPRSDFKAVRCIVQLPQTAVDNGCFFRFDVPSDHFVHPKNGICMNGKTMMRMNAQTPERLDFEFDNLPTVSVAKLLANMLVVRGEDLLPLDPIELTAVLTTKDDGLVHVHQDLDLDACNVDAPRLRVPSFDITVRGVCLDAPERLMAFVPDNPQFIFPSVCLTFPDNQQDVTGGCMRLDILGEAEPRATIGIRSFGDINVMSVRGQQLVCTNDGVSVPAGHVFGQDTASLVVTFPTDIAVSGEIVNALLRSIVFNSNRRTAPKREHLRPLTLRLYLDACTDAQREPIRVDFKLSILPPVIEASNKSSFGFSYREGAGAKCLPSMEIKQNTLRLGAEARLWVRLVAGVEETDTLDVAGKEFDEASGCFVFKHKSLPIAWWRPREETGLPKSELMLYVSGSVGIRDWMRESLEQPYPVENFLPANVPETSIAGVNVLLRSITFELFTDDPAVLKKNVLVTLDDGRFGRSHIPFDLTVEAVDDPTEVILAQTDFEYRQNSLNSLRGFSLFPGVEFNDPDSDNFHGGYIIIEHGNGPTEVGDHLYLMDRAQQEVFVHQRSASSSVSCLAFLLSMQDTDDQSSAVFDGLDHLSMLVDEQPVRVLTVNEGIMYFSGEQIGKVVCKASAKDGPVYQLRLNFFNDNKFVAFDAAQYALRCVGYENKSPKMRPGLRSYTMKLNCTGLKTTTESVAKVNVTSYLAIMASPAAASTVAYEEGSKPKPLLRQVITAVVDTVTHAGFFRAAFKGGVVDPADELTFESGGDIKVKDKSVYFGKELVGIANPRKRNCDEIFVNFAKINNQSLQAFLRSFCFSNKSRDPLPGDRVIQIDCSDVSEIEMCTLMITVTLTCKDEPTEIVLEQVNHIYMSGSAPVMIARNAKVVDPDTKVFPPGSSLEVALSTRMRVGESITVHTTDAVTIQFDGGQVRFAHGPAQDVIAEATALAKKIDGLVCFSTQLRIFFSQGVTATQTQIESVLATLGYSNGLKADRGTKKSMQIVFSSNGKAMDRATVTIEIAPSLIDFSHTPLIMQVPNGTPVPLLEGARAQLLPEARFFEATLALVTGFDEGDRLSFQLLTDNAAGLTQENDQVLIPSVSEKGKRVLFATLRDSLAGGPLLRFRCESANNAAVQVMLRSVMIEATSYTAKEVYVEITAACVYGQTREVVRVRV